MMKKSALALALIGAFAAPAFAEETPEHTFTANVGAVTDYVFRGISQSQHQPAIQGGVDYAHSSGLYVGTWASTIEWADRKDLQIQKGNNLEVDLYGGYKFNLGDVAMDVGAIRYYYPGKFNPAAGTTANTSEVYLGATYGIASLKYNHVVSQNIFNWGGTTASTESKGSGYIDLTVTYPVDETLNLIAHVGRQNIKNDSDVNNAGNWSYTDYKLGVTKDLGVGVVGLAYTDTNAKFSSLAGSGNYNFAGKNVGKGVLAASFTKTF